MTRLILADERVMRLKNQDLALARKLYAPGSQALPASERQAAYIQQEQDREPDFQLARR